MQHPRCHQVCPCILGDKIKTFVKRYKVYSLQCVSGMKATSDCKQIFGIIPKDACT